jgi:hypothetical protein
MGAHNSRMFNNDMSPLTIAKFVEYDNHIKQAFSDNLTDKNINGLKCYDEDKKINYRRSEFGSLDRYIKSYYIGIIKTKLNVSFLSAFLIENPNKGTYINESIVFNTTQNIIKYYTLLLVNTNQPIDSDLILYNTLYNNKIDIIKNQSHIYSNENIYSEGSINLDEESVNLDEEENKLKIAYKEAYEKLDETYIEYFNNILIEALEKPVGFLNYISVHYLNTLHCISIIVFYNTDTDTYYFKLYDPMFYIREQKNTSYVLPLIYAYIYIKLLAIKTEINVDIENISEKYCVKSDKGIHCSQYVIDAEYCSMFSLYFLFLFGKNNFDVTNKGLKKIVEETFISNPTDLKRNQCTESNAFRIVFMSFIMTILIIISDDENLLNTINRIKNKIINYQIIHKDIELLLDNKLSKIQKNKQPIIPPSPPSPIIPPSPPSPIIPPSPPSPIIPPKKRFTNRVKNYWKGNSTKRFTNYWKGNSTKRFTNYWRGTKKNSEPITSTAQKVNPTKNVRPFALGTTQIGLKI